jgi:lysophospholipase L1-like esterase
MWPKMEETNQLIREVCNTELNCTYIDVTSRLLDEGLPKQDIFIDDDLHLNKKGYQLWSKAEVEVIEAREVNKNN